MSSSNSPTYSHQSNERRPTVSRRRVLAAVTVLAIVSLGLTLRSPISSLAVVLPDVQHSLQMSQLLTSFLTTAPVLCFALIGLWFGPRIFRLGLRRAAILILVVMSVGLAIRAASDGGLLFAAATLVILSAIAIGNVLIPAAVKACFPHHVSGVSAVCAASIIGGATLGAVQAGWMQQIWGWRLALAGTTILAVVAICLWLPIQSGSRVSSIPPEPTISTRQLATLRPVWLLTVCFGLVTAQAYAQLGWYPAILIDTGLDNAAAAGHLALLTGIGIPTMVLLPALTRLLGLRGVIVALAAATALGWLGLICAPQTMTWLWSALIGVGAGSFAWTLTMIGRHAESPVTTSALSGFVQGVGFVFAIVGPLGVGLLRDVTGSWTASLWLLVVVGLGIGAAGVFIAHRWSVEDLLGASSPRRSTG
ncbi:MFS transporter [Gordonia terrae]